MKEKMIEIKKKRRLRREKKDLKMHQVQKH